MKAKNGGQSSSHATQCAWPMQKFKASAPTSAGVGLRPAAAVGDSNPIAAFVTTFLARINQDGDLSSQWQQVQQGVRDLGHTSCRARPPQRAADRIAVARVAAAASPAGSDRERLSGQCGW